jgi:secretion/DNA translocation related TadE-like protein
MRMSITVRSQKGSGSVLALALVAAIAFGGMAIAALGGAAAARWRSQTASDLAALAGAQAMIDGQGIDRACAVAGDIAAANGARLTACGPADGDRLRVRTEAPAPSLFGLPPRTASAEAVAGPP